MSKKTRKPVKFLNLKLLEKFLRDYRKMPYKSKSTIMTAMLVLLLIPLALIYSVDRRPTSSLELAPLEILPPPAECFITGCASHLCLDEKIDVPSTTCDYRPEYTCLKQARCERQPQSGRCGWSDTPKYLQCLLQINP